VTAYLLSQADLIIDVEFVFGAFRTYQVPVRRIETLTGLDLAHLRGFDPLDADEGEAPVRPMPLGSWRDIVIRPVGKG
jgi:endonuclease G